MNNYNPKFKIAFITILFQTSSSQLNKLKEEINGLGLKNHKLFIIDNTHDNIGFAAGVNKGVKEAMSENFDLFVILNPDISLKNLKKHEILEGSFHFDIWGMSFSENNQLYYGGEIDKWRGSGGLITKKPAKRFTNVDFVSGSLMFIKKEVIEKVGLFDENYFLYYEDVDYCRRSSKCGFKIGIDSHISYERLELSTASPNKNNLLFKNKFLYLLKHGTLRQRTYEILRSPKTFIEYIKTKPFLFNFFSLNFSSFFNKSIHFLLFIFLINQLTVQQYGIYVLIWAHIALLSPILDFGTTSYGLVYLSNETKNKFFSLFSLKFFLSLFVFAGTILMAWIFRYNPTIKLFIFLTSFTIFSFMLSGTYLILTSLKEKIYLASFFSMIFNLVSTLSIILILFLYKNFFLLFLSIFVFYNLYSILLFILLRIELGEIKFKFDLPNWLPILKKSIIFLVISFLAGLYFKLDVFLLNFLKGTSDVGIYSSGYKFLDASLIIASSYNVSATPILAKLKNIGKIPLVNKIKKDMFFLLMIGILITVGTYFLSPIILPFILKGDYQKAIQVLKIIIFAFPCILLTSVFCNGLYVMGKAYWVAIIFLFQIIFNFTLNYLLIPHYSYFASSYITVAGEILNTSFMFIIFTKYLKKLKT